MRALHVTTWNERCGIAIYAANITRELTALGVEQAIVARQKRGAAVDLGGLPVLAVFDASRPKDAAARILASATGFDVVHLEFNFGVVPPSILFRVVPALVARGVRVVVTFHSVASPEHPLFWARALPRLAGATIVLLGVATWPFESVARRFVDITRVHLGIPSSPPVDARVARARLGVAGRGATGSLVDGRGATGGLADAHPVISTSGFALAHKRFDKLIAALPTLAREFPNVALVGACTRYPSPSSGKVIEDLAAQAKRLGVADRVHLSHDFLDDDGLALRLYAGDVIALPYGRTRELASAVAAVALGTGRRVAVSDAMCFDAVRPFTEPLGDDVAGDLARLLRDEESEERAASRREALMAEHAYAAVARKLHAIYQRRP